MLNKLIANYRNISVIFIFFVILIMNQNIYGQNIIKNPGFEKMDKKDSFPAKWGKHWICKGEYPLKRDPMFAHSGAVCVGISQTGPNAYVTCTTLGSARCTASGSRQYTLYFWAKGKGKISSMVYLYGAGRFLQAPPKAKLSSKWFVINSKDWKSYKVNIVIPPEGVRQDNKKLSAIDEFEVLFNVQKGPVFIDDVELYLKGTKPKKKASIMKSGEPPFITITKMASPPLINGEISKKEWSQASGTTGFFELGARRQAKRQTELLVGFDEKNLYIAFSSKQKALLLGKGPKKYDFEFANDMEGFELWIQPPGKGFLQFIGVPAGGTLDRSKDNLKNGWSKKVKFANKIEGSGEMMGGTLTLGHKLWTGELAIPFASIGVTAPKDGEVWRMNFCRDFSVQAGQARSNSDWTTWSPMKNGFADVSRFGYVKFNRKAPALKLQSFGDLNSGNLDLQGDSNGEIKLNACVALDKRLDKKILDIDKQFSAAGKFQLKSAIKTSAAGITGMRMFMNVENAVDSSLLARAEIPFELFPTFWIKSQIFYSAQRLEVEIDASRSANLPKFGNIEVGVFKQENDKAIVLKKQKLNLNKTKFTMNLSIKDILPGSYVLKGFIKNQKDKIIASTSEPIIVPKTPVWLGNKIGISEEVPSPFTPVKVDGNKVGVILREYTLANSGLPSKVISLGKNILAAPAVLSAVVNGEEINWKFKPLEKVEQKAREVIWKISGDSKYLKLSGTLKIEFDGFGTWDIKVIPKQSVIINKLSLDFPINEESALFAKGDGRVVASIMQDKYTRAPDREDVVTLGNKVTEWGFWSYSRKGWIWDQFFNEIYIGSEQRGFSIGTETDQNVFAKKYVQFIPAKNMKLVKMRINLVSKNTKISKALPYKYFYQTTPFKPEPKDPKVWHIGFDPSDVYAVHSPGYTSEKGKEFLSSLYVGMIYYALKPDGYPRWVHPPKDSRKCLKFFQDFGPKIVHNLWYSALATNLPEYKTFDIAYGAT